jgi:glutamate-5-semialdehyde dehydrogenase
MRVPLGVVGIIYESRPDVTSDAAAICVKSGNSVILRGGSDAINSNLAICEALRTSLAGTGVPEDAVQIITSTDRSVAEEFMQMHGYVDVLIPRGGADLIRTVVEKAKIPVIETGLGNCHIYIEEDADLEKAVPIIITPSANDLERATQWKSCSFSKIAERFLPWQSPRSGKRKWKSEATNKQSKSCPT